MPYTKNTIRRAEQILGYSWSTMAGERTYTPVNGVLYVDLFEGDLPEGLGVKSFNGRVNAVEYYNQIELTNSYQCEPVAVDLNWGSSCFDSEIAGLLTWLEENPVSDSLDEAGVKSKKIEDFDTTKGSAAEVRADVNVILHDGYGYYVRRPLIIDVSKEHRYGYRYF